ncbi:MAG: ligD [Pseudobdellovibrio sp.]|nr:ligD [Pseudobdellovibrio sp.]
MGLKEYRRKRDFKKTKEPAGGKISRKKPIFVIQEHWASHHHFDFRLEAFGVLKSWAVPKGPPTEPGEKRLAVEVEDHPISYAKFHGTIPEGEYGGGEVEIWDKGHWVPPENIKQQLEKGHLEVELHGKKLNGRWLLQRTSRTSGKKNQWLLIKRHDEKEIKATEAKKKKKKDPWPGFLAPQLALLSDSVPEGIDWIHETKYDGYRTSALINKRSVKLYTRNGLDWTEKYGDIHDELQKLKTSNAILDGEIVVLDENGVSSFSMLQAALSDRDSSAMKYFVFDLLFLDGEDLRDKPLEERKILLKKLLKTIKSKKILFSEHIRGQGDEMFKLACQEGLEGIISKDRTAPYHAGRKSDWQKIKCSQRQELVIGGYTNPEGSRAGFGSLLMGIFEKGHLRYVGRVGTGFTDKNLAKLYQKLIKLETDDSPFTDGSPKAHATIHWVKPQLVAEVEFGSWTADGIIRHAAFVGLREDKTAKEVHMEKAAHVNEKAGKKKSSSKKAKGFVITHPDRIVYPSTGTKKIDVVNYYKSVSPWIMKHISGRPLALIRCPDGVSSTCFFQKQADENSKLTEVNKADADDQRVMSVDSEEGLLQLIQWGALELHTWQAHQKSVMYPDQLVFDLDPDEGLSWAKVREAAFRLKDLLKRLKLESFIKTTGGKGLHIHVPIAPLYTWDQIKNFCKSVTIQLSSEYPDDYTTNILKKNRKGRIFLDYLRNGFGATAIAPFSVRAKEKPTVAVPITWDELKKIKGPDQFDIHSTLRRLAKQKKDPWAGYEKLKQKILILKKKESLHAATL